MIFHPAQPQLAPRVQAYLAEIAGICGEGGNVIVSVILFGSASIGGFVGSVSDVDLILVLHDGAGPADRIRLRDHVMSLEVLHGLRQAPRRRGALEVIADRITANDRSFFVCTRADLLSGLPSRVLNLPPAQAFFVDRIVIPGILSCSVTVWGEELLADVTVQPIRRFDVFKAFFGLFCQAAMSAALFPFLSDATRYAMVALKRSVRSCYFCYHARHAALEQEIEFFQKRSGQSRVALDQLLALRSTYNPSFAFIARCMPTLVRLHMRTALDYGP
jgi:hypothetical protein